MSDQTANPPTDKIPGQTSGTTAWLQPLPKSDRARSVMAALADYTHNTMFPQLLEQMRETFESFWDHPFDRIDFARRTFPFHRELFDAITAQDPDRARLITLAILAIVEEDIKEMSK